MRRLFSIGTVLIAALQFSATTYADPISLTGFITFNGFGGVSDFALRSRAFDVHIPSHEFIFLTDDAFPCGAPPCRPSDLSSPRWRGVVEASGTVNSKSYPTVFGEDPVGGLAASADLGFTFTRPIASPGNTVGAAPFTMAGRLVLRPESALDTIVFDSNVIGSGSARIHFTTANSPFGTSVADSLTFDLQKTSPTPEPSTLVMLTAGFACLAAGRRTRRRHLRVRVNSRPDDRVRDDLGDDRKTHRPAATKATSSRVDGSRSFIGTQQALSSFVYPST
jgi:hypothetical protein